MADQSGSQIVTGTTVPTGSEAEHDALARAEPGAQPEPGSPPRRLPTADRSPGWPSASSWAGFLCGGLSLISPPGRPSGLAAGLVVVAPAPRG